MMTGRETLTGVRNLENLAYERIDDVRVTYDPTKFNPFTELAVEKDDSLVLTVYEHGKNLSLTIERWDEISRRARAYHAEVLASGEDW
ncbi:hypothetical protein R75483_07772 [Paraburkholderia domus]|nr:hypothetical protein R75483_07772 [Paraburkholderia domus]